MRDEGGDRSITATGDSLASLLTSRREDWLMQADVVNVKPGQRITARFQLADGQMVFGKSFDDPERARRLWDIHQAMWRGGVRVPRPIALLDEACLVLYEATDGDTLESLLSSADAEAWVVRAGQWLAKLHATPIPLAHRFDLSTELDNLAEWTKQIGAVNPQVARRAEQLLGALARIAPGLNMAGCVVIHKDFHAGHVLIGSDVTVIDLDEARLGDPAFDIGHFIAYLQLAAWRDQAVDRQFARLRTSLLDGYRFGGLTISKPVVRWSQAYAFIKIARQLALGLGVAPHPVGSDRDDQIDRAVSAGEVCLAPGPER
jgi:aminoglycoside phosphotransferase (APT) family kinase protein